MFSLCSAKLVASGHSWNFAVKYTILVITLLKPFELFTATEQCPFAANLQKWGPPQVRQEYCPRIVQDPECQRRPVG